ncbi:hypothetical protein [Rhodopila globiformis]|uniref:hypothetical protein n=1 Tax=Rhodopila globiformis TaxID=1071 RepID=UPI00147618FE|nr:hypothetical protein [Rhodopila globiformis]
MASHLANAYKFKEVADYAVGSQSVVTLEEAEEVIGIAARFIDTISHLLAPRSPSDS